MVGPGGKGLGDMEEGKRVTYMVTNGDETLGGEDAL